MTSSRLTRTFRKKSPGRKSWAAPDIVWPSFAAADASEYRATEPEERKKPVGTAVYIAGFRKRKIVQPKAPFVANALPIDPHEIAAAYSPYASAQVGAAHQGRHVYSQNPAVQQTVIKAGQFHLLLEAPGEAVASKFEEFLAPSGVAAKLEEFLSELVERKLRELLGGAVPPSPSGLADARSRGNAYKKAELSKPENAQLKEASVYAGTSDRTINKWRNAGCVYALVQEGKSRGFRYPLWQFDADRNRLSKALRPLQEVHASPWVIHNFFLRPNSFLSGLSPREWILDSSADIEQLVRVTRDRFAGDQGAS